MGKQKSPFEVKSYKCRCGATTTKRKADSERKFTVTTHSPPANRGMGECPYSGIQVW